jgi:ABC-type nitrate/sulfonate/bicarbonate transport system substrate-binding protein
VDRFRRRRAAVSAVAVLVGLLSGCGASEPAASSSPVEKVRIALDWVPNTNHAGLYVAMANGWFREAGVEVTVLPYSSVGPDALVAQGKADLGYSFVPSLLGSRASGLKIKAVSSVLAHNLDAAVVLADSPYRRPRDLARASTYLGFGAPAELPVMNEVIRRDGGKPGEITSRAVNSSAYQDLYHHKGDFSQLFLGWEPFQAALRTPPVKIRVFPVRDALGPTGDWPSVILISSEKTIAARPEALRRTLGALDRGYHLAGSDPAAVTKALTDADRALAREPVLVRRSAQFLTKWFLNADGTWGRMRPGQFTGLRDLLVRAKALRGRDGAQVTNLAADDLFTNALLPGGQ